MKNLNPIKPTIENCAEAAGSIYMATHMAATVLAEISADLIDKNDGKSLTTADIYTIACNIEIISGYLAEKTKVGDRLYLDISNLPSHANH